MAKMDSDTVMMSEVMVTVRVTRRGRCLVVRFTDNVQVPSDVMQCVSSRTDYPSSGTDPADTAPPRPNRAGASFHPARTCAAGCQRRQADKSYRGRQHITAR